MRLSKIAIAVIFSQSAVSFAMPDLSQVGQAAAGGAVGGFIGNQIGNGRGKTLATAAGAVTGVVIASGCKATAKTAIGGLIGGLIGSQFGGGNGSKALAGVGAGVGALLGSDCQAAANPVAPTPLPNMAPFTMNELTLTPMNGFPQEAFMGIPPIVTPQDVLAAAGTVRKLADLSAQARADGNPELSFLSMYWAKRISATTVGILSASLNSIATNTGKTASIPAKGVVILPSFNEYSSSDTQNQALLNALSSMMAANEYAASKGVMVADLNGFSSAMNFLNNIGNKLAQPQPQAAPAPAPVAQAAPAQAASQPHKGLVGLPLNVVVKLPDGTFAMQSDDALTLYNPNDTATDVPLNKLDFKVRTAAFSEARKAAAPMMFKINDAANNWEFSTYIQFAPGAFEVNEAIPNKLVDVKRHGTTVSYVEGDGSIGNDPTSGKVAYRTDSNFRNAMNLLQDINTTKSVNDFTDVCLNDLKLSQYETLDGKYARILQNVCFDGAYGNQKKMYVRTYFIGELGKNPVQTSESANMDKANQNEMTKALTNGAAFSDVLSLVPVAGNVESGLRCLGDYTMAQQAAIGNALMRTGLPASDLPFSREKNMAIAKLSGWTPPPADEWSFDRVVNCASALPLAGYAGTAVKAMDHAAGNSILSGMSQASIDKLHALAEAFNSPSSISGYFKGIQNVNDLFPSNPKASAFVKSIYDMVSSGQGFYQASQAITGQLIN